MIKFVLLFFISLNFAFAQLTTLKPVSTEQVQTVLSYISKSRSLEKRALTASAYFVEHQVPYEIGAAGEGSDGDYDQRPLSTWEKVDCVTYVEAVLAIALVYPKSKNAQTNLEAYFDHIKEIKYNDFSNISFLTRNHFTELDWIPHLQDINLLKDVTLDIYPDAPMQSKLIDKEKWFLSPDTIRHLYVPNLTVGRRINKLLEYRQEVLDLKLEPQVANLHYLPLSVLKNKKIQKRLPNFSVFSLVRAEDPKMPVMVSHQGFVVRKNGKIFVRNASSRSIYMKVVDIPLDEYIELRLKDAWPSLGLNLQALQ